jgi:hypothetical protein
MLRVNVTISNISAERLLDFRKPFPQVHINTNLNLTGTERKPDESLDVPFVLTISYNPSVARISLKGTVYVVGDKGETEKVYKEYEEKKRPPPDHSTVSVERCLHRVGPDVQNLEHSAAHPVAPNIRDQTGREETLRKGLQRLKKARSKLFQRHVHRRT